MGLFSQKKPTPSSGDGRPSLPAIPVGPNPAPAGSAPVKLVHSYTALASPLARHKSHANRENSNTNEPASPAATPRKQLVEIPKETDPFLTRINNLANNKLPTRSRMSTEMAQLRPHRNSIETR